MNELHKGWGWSLLSMAGSVGTFLTSHGVAMLIALGTLLSITFAIRASASAKDASDEQKRLTSLQIKMIICHECIAENAAPHPECPHPFTPLPNLCQLNKPKDPKKL